jgi:hypothetical protein
MKFMKLGRLTLVASIALGCLAGDLSTASAQQGEIIIRTAPPRARAEARGSYRAGYEWVPGYWRWDGRGHVWISGHWERARAGYVWQPARWERRYDGYVFVPGRWVRAGRHAAPPPVYGGPPPYRDRPGYRRPHRRPDWGRQGWVLVGENWVTGREDHDFVPVGRRQGRFGQLLISTEEGDFVMRDMTIEFSDGRAWSPSLRQYFREGSRSRVLNIPNGPRGIRSIRFTYGDLPGGGRALVQVWAR